MIYLANSTQNNLVDDVLQNIIEIFEANFPQRIRAYYVEGSYADASNVTTSDLDVLLIYKESFESKAPTTK